MKPTSPLLLRTLVAAMAMCLVLAQALWLLHRVGHVRVVTHTASDEFKASAWMKAVLPDHQDERSCAQYDQLSHADMAPGCHALHLTQGHSDLAQAAHVASSMAAQAAGFLARGPPAIA